MGMAEVVVRQQLSSNIGALFLDNMKSFLLTELVHIWADPRPLKSNTVPSGPDIATIRIKAQASTANWKIVQDFRDKTVLNGFANVGGLWTFLDGIFAALFGSALLKIILGLKPLGIFGTAHSFQSKRLRAACITEYPRLEKDIAPPEKERGLLNMICDHLLDVDFLAPPDTPNKSRRASEMTQKSLLEDDTKTLNDNNGSHSKWESSGLCALFIHVPSDSLIENDPVSKFH
ncbi:hypothetical protein CPB83DRAFT_518581 [Crepidotus variabilis]|uniref:Uncharacterized protein n=1 Tax=Crepidotus variabilis TaxID=179855 RepID=A0A9P6EB07_9AGAR|nr:hypothetical protein CPB83DRAFT_518581 [Crepidotus variabilis]